MTEALCLVTNFLSLIKEPLALTPMIFQIIVLIIQKLLRQFLPLPLPMPIVVGAVVVFMEFFFGTLDPHGEMPPLSIASVTC